MTTRSDLVDKVRYLLRSFTGQHELSTHLTSGIDADDVSLAVGDGGAVSTGVVEIGDELIWVDSTSGGVLTVPPYGRGYMSSVAATHATGVQVITDPFFPRKHVADALVDTQRALYPTLFQPKAFEFVFVSGQASYDLDDDTDRILSVSAQLPGVSGFWTPLRRWRLDSLANDTSFPSGNSITLFDAVSPDATVRVVYAAPFTELDDGADTLATAGHPESHADLLAYGAAWRLVQFLEVSRLNLGAVENQERSKYAAAGAASALTRQILAIYEKRLEEERARLLQQYPYQLRFTR